MTYHDDIITITLCRGELAASLGEQGLMVKNWTKFTAALQRELSRETPSRGDGHTGTSDIGDLLIERIASQYEYDSGLVDKPMKAGSKNECWPEGQKWFDGEERE